LDEPFAALDPAGKELTLDLLEGWRRGGSTLVLSTHEPELAARVATRHVTLAGGLLAEGA
ncbi:MAG TPA: ABC transporter ATP-binding protein, partial [Deinococcales bacterium]|nr:ABC transporter ATP-binding protein [Deinococcales bacterium]